MNGANVKRSNLEIPSQTGYDLEKATERNSLFVGNAISDYSELRQTFAGALNQNVFAQN